MAKVPARDRVAAALAAPKRAALAAALHARFAALPRAHGQFTLSGTLKGKKVEGRAALVKEPATVATWEAHLAGKTGLGLIPIRDDGTCRWGAIDVDVYDGLDLAAVAARVVERRFPLIVCRSKSGGAHLYLFGSEDLPADLLRTKLMELAVALGFAGVEVFPKQTALASVRDFGHWINLPYFHATVTTRFALGPAGGQLTAAQFLAAAEAAAVTVDQLSALAPGGGDEFTDGPPCLQTLAARGFPEGSRNNAAYNLAVYLRKKHGDGAWDQALLDLNVKYVKPPLAPTEVAGIAKSVRKKSYEFKCREAPIHAVCNKAICLTRQFGIRGARNDPGVVFGELTKIPTDPPVYLWDVNGQRLELTATELMDQRRFNRICFETLDVWPLPVRPVDWQRMIREKLEKIEVAEAPDDASRPGRVWQLLEEFCRSRAHGLSRDELLMKKPWTEAGRTYFRFADLMEYLEQHRLHSFPERDAWMILRRHGATHGRWNVKGREVKWWSVPVFPEPTAPLDVPATQQQPI